MTFFSAFGAPANVPQPVLAPLHQQGPEFVLCLRDAAGFYPHPFNSLAHNLILDGDPGAEFPVASPQAPICVLAAIQDFGVSMSS